MSNIKVSLPWVIAIFFAGLFFGQAASGVLAHGGDPALIHACVKNNGSIRIVEPTEACKNNETTLDWNIQGEPGPQGSEGEPGPQGEPGVPGKLSFHWFAPAVPWDNLPAISYREGIFPAHYL